MVQAPPNYFDAVQELLGDEIRNRNEFMIEQLGEKNLRRLRETYLAKYNKLNLTKSITLNSPFSYYIPNLESGEFRPFLHGIHHRDAVSGFGGNSSADFNPDEELRAERSKTLRRMLLYAHRFVIPDPLLWINQYFQGRENALFHLGKKRLVEFLDLLYKLEPLIKNGTILFYPLCELHFLSDRISVGEGIEDPFKDSGFHDWIESQSLGLEDTNDEFLEKFKIMKLQTRISEMLFFCSRYGAHLLMDQPELLTAFQYMEIYDVKSLRQSMGKKPLHIVKEEQKNLGTLARIELPDQFSGIKIEDIVLARQNEEAFEEYRESLRSGLKEAHEQKLEDDPEEIRKIINWYLRDGRQKLEKQIKEASVLSIMKEKMTDFTWGSFINFLINPAALTGSVFSVLGKTVKAAVEGELDNARRAALLKHYAVWSEE